MKSEMSAHANLISDSLLVLETIDYLVSVGGAAPATRLVDYVMNISDASDEMACRLSSLMRGSEEEIGRHVKAQIRERVGDWLTCSVGIAPNIFLAKVASETQKPDGLTIWCQEDLPQAAFCLELRDLPGIGPRMHIRLQAKGIHTVEQLYQASAEDLWRVTGSIVGKRWYHMLRGSQ